MSWMIRYGSKDGFVRDEPVHRYGDYERSHPQIVAARMAANGILKSGAVSGPGSDAEIVLTGHAQKEEDEEARVLVGVTVSVVQKPKPTAVLATK